MTVQAGRHWVRHERPARVLKPAEIDVLELVRLGLTMEQIGHTLYLSPATVKDRLRAIYGVFELDFGPQNQLMAALRWEAIRAGYAQRVAALHAAPEPQMQAQAAEVFARAVEQQEAR